MKREAVYVKVKRIVAKMSVVIHPGLKADDKKIVKLMEEKIKYFDIFQCK